jgi:hypothetical protein
MTDVFGQHMKGLESPATKKFAITPSDTATLDQPPRGIHCNAAGTLYAIFADEDGKVIADAEPLVLIAGMYYPYRVKIVGELTDAQIIGVL